MRHHSKHAAGIVIGSRPLVETVPLCVDREGSVLTQFSGTDIEKVGLVKFDFLGLKNLTLIQNVVRRVREGRGQDVDVSTLPLDDKKTYRLLARGETVGVFQMESSGMRELVTRLKPTCFEDITAINASTGPGRSIRGWSSTSSSGSTDARRSPTSIRASSRSCARPTASSSTRSR
jgi:DNA polymerase-3 subunit alpha